MTKLSMHESLPFDEAATPPTVSTGDLPDARGGARDSSPRPTSATAPNGDGAVADYIPALAERVSGAVRHLRRRRAGAGRSRSATPTTPFSIQSVSKPFVFALVCEAIGYETARRAARGQQHGLPVQLGDGGRAQRRPHHEPDGQRRRDRDDQPGPRRHGGGEVGADPGRAVPVRRPRAHRGRARSTRPSRPPTCATRASPTCCESYERLYFDPDEATDVYTRQCSLERDRPRPRGDGGHARQRRGEPDDRRAGRRARECAAGCWP